MEELYAQSRSFRVSDCLKEAADLWRFVKARQFHWIEGQLQIELAVCAFHNGEFETAVKGIDRALEQIDSAGFETLHLRGVGIRAEFLTRLGDTATAALANWRGLDLFWKGVHPPNRAFQFHADLYLAAEREQRWRSAHAFAREGVETIALGPNRLTEAMARSRLASFALQVGETREALQQAELAAALLKQFDSMASAHEYRLENLIVLASAYLAAGRDADAAATVAGFHSSDSRSVFARIALHRIYGVLHQKRGEWDKAREEFLASANVAQNAIQSLFDDAARLRWKREAGLVFRSLAQLALDYEHNPETALGFWEWYRSAPIRNRVDPFAPNLTETLKSRLGMYSTASVLSWAQVGDRIGIWFYDDRGIRFAWSPASAASCNALSARFARLCSRPDSSIATLRAVGAELYRILLEPVAGNLDVNRILLIEPDVVTGPLAMEALVQPDGRWLGENFTIITSPGLWAELALRERRSVVRASAQALVVGNPWHRTTGAEFFAPLPDADRESQFVGQMFPSGRLLRGGDATSHSITLSLPEAELFHFAGHARFDGESARLLLAGDGAFLDSKAIEKSAKRCSLAVLSACSTATVDRDGPWSVESLVQAFWRSGTPQIIASRWEVDSKLTAQLFGEFYTHLLRGDTGAESLRRAAATVRSIPGSSHPFFWAAFHTFGCLPTDFRHHLKGDRL